MALKKTYTIGDSVYEQLLEEILTLQYLPGEKLSEILLAEKYGVSRAPVRNALGRLEQDGLVRIKPQSGTIVSEISIQKALHICEIRLLLERYAIYIAAQTVTDGQLAQLQRWFDRLELEDPAAPDYTVQLSKVDHQLHQMIYDACGNPLISEIISRYNYEIQRIKHINGAETDRPRYSKKEICQIFAALKARNPEQAAQAMEVHINNIQETLKSVSLEEWRNTNEKASLHSS